MTKHDYGVNEQSCSLALRRPMHKGGYVHLEPQRLFDVIDRYHGQVLSADPFAPVNSPRAST